MFARSLGFAFAIGAAMLVSQAANATVVSYTDKATWTAAAGSPVFNTTTDSNPLATWITSIDLNGGGALSLSDMVIVAQAGTPSWATWSGGYTGIVYDVHFDKTITLSFSGLSGFGLEIEPAPQTSVDINVTLNDGTTFTHTVNGLGGAAFFGWTGEGIDSLTISSSEFFAFGNLYSVKAANAAPEPLTLALLGTGLAGMTFVRRRKRMA